MLSKILKIMTPMTLSRKIKLCKLPFWFSNMCGTWIWIGIKMESRIQICINTMPIHNTEFVWLFSEFYNRYAPTGRKHCLVSTLWLSHSNFLTISPVRRFTNCGSLCLVAALALAQEVVLQYSEWAMNRFMRRLPLTILFKVRTTIDQRGAMKTTNSTMGTAARK
jgi:hypothetical protein